ncbi:MAG: hypothetical protein I3J02_10680 [Prevotella sp.]|nr:hypothetical protein [Prevotella sp.]
MEREEKFIEDKFGRRSPFKVPEGYFDDFASQLMQRLPDRVDTPTTKVVPMRSSSWHRTRPIAIAAASICAAIFSLGVFMHNDKDRMTGPTAAATHGSVSSTSYSAVDAMADYAMLDTEDMYAYLEDTK